MRYKKIEQKYDTVAKVIAHYPSDYIGLCTDGKQYLIYKRNEIYDYINPLSPYKEASFLNDILCIIV